MSLKRFTILDAQSIIEEAVRFRVIDWPAYRGHQEDIVSAVILRVISSKGSDFWFSSEHFTNYLRKVSKNVFADYRRDNPEKTNVNARAIQEVLHRELAKLYPRGSYEFETLEDVLSFCYNDTDRQIVFLRLQSKTYKQIGEELDINWQAVGRRLRAIYERHKNHIRPIAKAISRPGGPL